MIALFLSVYAAFEASNQIIMKRKQPALWLFYPFLLVPLLLICLVVFVFYTVVFVLNYQMWLIFCGANYSKVPVARKATRPPGEMSIAEQDKMKDLELVLKG